MEEIFEGKDQIYQITKFFEKAGIFGQDSCGGQLQDLLDWGGTKFRQEEHEGHEFEVFFGEEGGPFSWEVPVERTQAGAQFV
jgi:hypothetical protein